MKAIVEIKAKHSRGSSSNRFGGPNRYVVVQVVPEGIEPLKVLNRKVAERRGILLIDCGEGYGEHCGPRSMLGRAIMEAERIAKEWNEFKPVL